jgi:excisionase family DNA binding protein
MEHFQSSVLGERIRAFYPIPQAAEYLNISCQLLIHLAQTGEIKSAKIGARRMIPTEALFDYERHVIDPTAPYEKGKGWDKDHAKANSCGRGYKKDSPEYIKWKEKKKAEKLKAEEQQPPKVEQCPHSAIVEHKRSHKKKAGA